MDLSGDTIWPRDPQARFPENCSASKYCVFDPQVGGIEQIKANGFIQIARVPV